MYVCVCVVVSVLVFDVMVQGAAVMSDTRPSLSGIAEGKRYLSDGTQLNE